MVVKLYGNAFRLVMIPLNNAGAVRSGRAVRGVQMPSFTLPSVSLLRKSCPCCRIERLVIDRDE
jgi:hypothetical protein